MLLTSSIVYAALDRLVFACIKEAPYTSLGLHSISSVSIVVILVFGDANIKTQPWQMQETSRLQISMSTFSANQWITNDISGVANGKWPVRCDLIIASLKDMKAAQEQK